MTSSINSAARPIWSRVLLLCSLVALTACADIRERNEPAPVSASASSRVTGSTAALASSPQWYLTSADIPPNLQLAPFPERDTLTTAPAESGRAFGMCFEGFGSAGLKAPGINKEPASVASVALENENHISQSVYLFTSEQRAERAFQRMNKNWIDCEGTRGAGYSTFPTAFAARFPNTTVYSTVRRSNGQLRLSVEWTENKHEAGGGDAFGAYFTVWKQSGRTIVSTTLTKETRASFRNVTSRQERAVREIADVTGARIAARYAAGGPASFR